MKNVSGRFWYVCAVVALLAASTAVQAATVSLKAMRVNGSPITPTNELAAAPGDVIYAELFASEWSPAGQECRLWQVTVDTCSFFSGPCGAVVPLGWERPAECVPEFCTPGGPNTCSGELECHSTGICAGSGHDPLTGIFMDVERTDYIYQVPDLPAVDPIYYRYGSTILGGTYPVYEPPPKYLGTLILVASNDVCGQFEIGFVEVDTFLRDEWMLLIEPLELEPLTITFGEPPPQVERTYPGNCALDARQPHEPDGSSPTAWDSIDFHFCPGTDLSGIVPGDFTVRRIPASFPPPMISGVDIDDDNDVVTVVTNGSFHEQVWTCIDFVSGIGDNEVCVGVLPGDVDNDRFSAQIDATKIINHLTGAPTGYELYQCDIDRSGRCTAADLIREIDLLNGGDAYAPGYVGMQMDPNVCPTLGHEFPPCPEP